jgi:signal transduction histidine kinase
MGNVSGKARRALEGSGMNTDTGSSSGFERTAPNEPEPMARHALPEHLVLEMLVHELRTPLQSLVGAVELLEATARGAVDPVLIRRMHRHIDLLAAQLDSASFFARTGSGRGAAKVEEISLVPLLELLASEARPLQREDQPGVAITIESNTPLVVVADKVRLQQVIMNYLVNATKYAQSGQITLGARSRAIRHAGETTSPGVEIYVRDEGGGIEAKEVDKIWEPYYRTPQGEVKLRGSGLGLAVVKLLADSSNWEVGVSANEQRGACFFVVVPSISD